MSNDTNAPNGGLHSFSGTHAYRPNCVSDAAKLAAVTDFGYAMDDDEALSKIGAHWAGEVTSQLENGKCPRCRGALPEPPEFPAGSRVTPCRCIPICGRCGSDESIYPLPLWRWPTSRSAMSRRWNKLSRNATTAVLDLDSGRVISDTGSSEIHFREHPGGWAEFGHDEEDSPE